MSERIDLLDAIYTNRSIRRFRTDPVPDDVILKVIEAATMAPSGTNRQTWRFLVIRDPERRRRIGELYRRSFEAIYPADRLAAETDPNRRRVMRSSSYLAEHLGTEPPVLLLVCADEQDAAMRSPVAATAPWIAGSSFYPAVQNLLLAARAYGLGGCLTTIHVRYEAEVKEILGIPEGVRTYALIPLGYPVDRFGPLRRQPAAAVTFFDRWGAGPADQN